MDPTTPNVSHFFMFTSNHAEFMEFAIRFFINFIASLLVIVFIYKPSHKDQEYTFTFLIFSPLVFFIVNLFSQTSLGMGFAFGLFAVFSILRYRTTTIPVKEMTYMFTIISISVINAIINPSVNFWMLIMVNLAIILVVYITEKKYYVEGFESQEILYDKVYLLTPENKEALHKDLAEKMGTRVLSYEVLERDFVRDIARLKVVFKSE